MRDWLKDMDEIDRDCILRWEYLLGRKLTEYDEYIAIDEMIDEMILEWNSRREFFKEYPELIRYRTENKI